MLMKYLEEGDFMDLIRMKGVSKRYKNGVTAIYDLDLNIKKGEFVFIIGSTGCGKSTLIKMLYREEKPNAGKIIVGGVDVAKLRNRKVYKIRRKIGVVFQDFKLLYKSTVYENVAFAMRVVGTPGAEIRRRVPALLRIVNMDAKANHRPGELSGGEQQRIALARAIANNPDIIVADEPTGNIDPKMSLDIMNMLLRINRKLGKTVLVVTHEQNLVDTLGQRVINISHGNVIGDRTIGQHEMPSIG